MEFQRESIFVSSLRGFCRSLFVVLGITIGLVLVAFVFFAFSSPYQTEERTTLEILPNLDWKREMVSLSAPAILQINIHGVIGEPEQIDTESVKSILVDSRTGLLAHDRVKGILLHFDTPGGTVLDSDNIYRLLMKYKEHFKIPVFGYIDGFCASGGMYISSAADRLYCSPSAVVGSVGVRIGPFFNFYDAMTQLGIKAMTITAGIDKDMMDSFRPWHENEDASLRKVVASAYEQFLDVFTSARKRVDRAKLVAEYGADLFDSTTGQQIGYVDVANVDYDTALAALLEEAHIDPKAPYQIVELKPERGFLSSLVKSTSPLWTGIVEHKLPGQDACLRQEKIAYIYQP